MEADRNCRYNKKETVALVLVNRFWITEMSEIKKISLMDKAYCLMLPSYLDVPCEWYMTLEKTMEQNRLLTKKG